MENIEKAYRKGRPRWVILEELLDRNGFRFFAEIGVATGKTSEYILEKNPRVFITGVDPFLTYNDYSSDKNSKAGRIKKNRANVERQLLGNPRYTHKFLFSHEAVKKYADGCFCMIFIDANHKYGYVKRDLELWGPKVKKGGIIAGHDYIPVEKYNHSGVKIAVDEYVKEHDKELVLEDNSVWWFRK